MKKLTVILLLLVGCSKQVSNDATPNTGVVDATFSAYTDYSRVVNRAPAYFIKIHTDKVLNDTAVVYFHYYSTYFTPASMYYNHKILPIVTQDTSEEITHYVPTIYDTIRQFGVDSVVCKNKSLVIKY